MTHPNYTSNPYIYANKGLNARNTIDRLPDHTYWILNNAECRQENSIASRLGRSVVSANPSTGANAPLAPHVNTLARLLSLDGVAYRYGCAGLNIYRGNFVSGFPPAGSPTTTYSAITGTFRLSGNRLSTANYRPTNSSTPYIFFADSDCMVKDNGTLTSVDQWGIFPPTAPPTLTLEDALSSVPDRMTGSASTYTVINGSAPSNVTVFNTTIPAPITGAPAVLTVTPASMANIVPNTLLQIGATVGGFSSSLLVLGTSPTTFTSYFQFNQLAGRAIWVPGIQTVTTGEVLNITPAAGAFPDGQFGANSAAALAAGQGYIVVGLQVSDYTKLVADGFQVQIFVPGGTYTASLQNTPGVFALPTSNNYTPIAIPASAFQATGQAGNPGSTWVDAFSYAITVEFSVSSGETVTFAGFYYIGGGGPSVDNTGAVPYDYRITFYNANTGTESGPSVVQIPTNTVSPQGQPVLVNFADAVTPPPPIDPQVTDIRIYRRGGTLPNQWLQVGQVPIGTTTFLDTMTDEQIATANILVVDTAPPVTSTLPVPLIATLTASVGTGEQTATITPVPAATNLRVYQLLTIDQFTSSEETVMVQSTGFPGMFTAYFQYPHGAGASVYATTITGFPCGLATIAFNRAWVAGDTNNPDILYYSEINNPESFPVENFVEVGTPSDPIMAVVEWNGQLYVFTQNTVWNIIGAQGGTNAPQPYKTAANHGLNANFAWCLTEGEIYYQSFGGVYAFNGAYSRYASEEIEWVFTQQFLEDDILRPTPMMDPDQVAQTVMAYYQNEIYVSYLAGTGTDTRARVIYDKINNRWRADSAPANCMLVEQDIYTLLYGEDSSGLIYQDRTGNFDAASNTSTTGTPFTFNVQTATLDFGTPKNLKNFNEVTIDIDTGGLSVNVYFWYQNGTQFLNLGTVVSSGRSQQLLNINSGLGILSFNGSIQLTATISTDIASPIEVYEAHIRTVPEAELRKSYDTYLTDFGTPDYKFVKQGWFEYTSADVNGVQVYVYTDYNNFTGPLFEFTLPQATTRTNLRVRFPATKFRVIRFVATSFSQFQLYSDSRYEYKRVTQDKGYSLAPAQQEAPGQP